MGANCAYGYNEGAMKHRVVSEPYSSEGEI